MVMPAKKYDEEIAKKVRTYAAVGVPVKDISLLVGMTDKTLKKLYHKDWELGRAQANAKVGGLLFKKCEDGDITALIFWAKTQMGWNYNDGKDKKEDAENLKNLTLAISEAFKSVGN